MKRIGWIVKASYGQYEDHYVKVFGVWMNKEEAERKAKDLDDLYKNPPKPEWEEDEWKEDIQETIYKVYDDRPTEYVNKYPLALSGVPIGDFSEEDRIKYREEERSLDIDIVLSIFKGWTRQRANDNLSRQEFLDSYDYLEYNSAWVEEIEVWE